MMEAEQRRRCSHDVRATDSATSLADKSPLSTSYPDSLGTLPVRQLPLLEDHPAAVRDLSPNDDGAFRRSVSGRGPNASSLNAMAADAAAARLLEKRIVRKLDLIFLPWACISQLMKKIDQNNYKAAYTAGMKADLGLAGTNALNLLDMLFTIPFIVFLIPFMLLVTRIRPSYFLPTTELIWGILTACMAICTTVEQMYPIRFFIGAMETSCWCLITTLLLSWYTPREMAKRQALFLCASYAGGMFTFAMQSAIYRTLEDSLGMRGWRWLFVINGVMTVFVALAGFFAVPDYPLASKALWLSPQEKQLAYDRLLACGTRTLESLEQYKGWTGSKALLVKVARTAIGWKFPLLFLCYGCYAWASYLTGFFNLFLDSLHNADGSKMYTVEQVTEIPIATGAVAIVSALTIGYLSDRYRKRWQIAATLDCVLLYSAIVLSVWPKDKLGLTYSAFFIGFTAAANEALLMTWIGEICRDDPVERSLIIAMAMSLTMAGNVAFPLVLWPAKEAPRYRYGYKVSCGFCAVSLVGVLVFAYLQKRTERRRPEGSDEEDRSSSSSKDDIEEAK